MRGGEARGSEARGRTGGGVKLRRCVGLLDRPARGYARRAPVQRRPLGTSSRALPGLRPAAPTRMATGAIFGWAFLHMDTLGARDRLPEGAVINGRYTITGFLGQGGFATVYEGRDNLIQRPVAIKLLALHTADSDGRALQAKMERFHREATAAARIEHPNVVTIFDMGVTDLVPHRPFIVMERLHGQDLEQALAQRGPFAAHRALPLMIGALDALGAGHALGVIHKDLKPSNLFLVHPDTDKEDLRVLDFGIARLEDQRGTTGKGNVLGTPRYLAPEYIQDQIVSPPLDVYQMGLILVEVLTGRPAVDSTNPLECIVRHSRGDLHVDPSLTRTPLGPILARALALDPAQRYPDAAAFAAALRRVDPDDVNPLLDPDDVPLPRLIEDPSLPPMPVPPEVAPLPELELSLALPTALPLDSSPSLDKGALQRPLPLASQPETPARPLHAPTAPDFPTLPTANALPTEARRRPPTPPAPRAEQPQARSSSIAPIVGLVALAVLILAALYAAMINLREEPPAPTQDAAFVDPRVAIELVTNPPGATIIEAGKILGDTPKALLVEPDGDGRRVSLHHEGYFPTKIVVSPDDAPSKVVTLRKIQ